MGYREDYYKFSHKLLPQAFFSFGKTTIERILENKEQFIKKLKYTWESMQLDSRVRRKAPSFEIDIRELDSTYSLIVVKIPEANKPMETPYIGVLFDKDYNIRYFTYEISNEINGKHEYLMCEWTQQWEHLNYGLQEDGEYETFLRALESQLVCELF